MKLGVSSKCIAVVFWDGYLGVAPSLIAAIRALAAHGYLVDVILREPAAAYPPPPSFDGNRVRIISMQQLHVFGSSRSQSETKLRGPFRNLLCKIGRSLNEHMDRLRFLSLCRRLSKNEFYAAAIGVDEDGLIAASQIAARNSSVLLAWSLELDLLAHSRDPLRRFFHRVAMRCHNKAQLTIVQDEHRAARLEALRANSGANIRFVPNSPSGPPLDMRRRFFHSRFDLPANQRVVLHAGGIVPEMLIEEVARASVCWPADWSLILHERERRAPNSPYLRSVEAAGHGRVLFSLTPVPYEALDELFASADVTLALYSSCHGNNYRLMARASGKLAHSLRVGVPVVCSDLPGLSSLVTQYGCGVAVKGMDEVQPAIDCIFADYQSFRERAWACYREVFEFGRQFSGVLDEIDRLVQRTA